MAQNVKNNKNKGNKNQNKKGHQDKSAKKSKSSTKKSSVCPWLFGSFLLLGAIAGVLVYDTNVNGKGVFQKSVTGKFLKDAGALPYVETAWYTVMSNCARGYKWAEVNLPPVFAKACEVSKPYVDLSKDLLKIGCNTLTSVWENLKDLVARKGPVVTEFIEQYAPGLPQKIQDFSVSAWATSVEVYQNSCDFMKTKVFVGNLSPENLSKALNQTQAVAAEYYSWFHEKVDAYAKIK
ncbi:unnamed protein product [Hermetia illucens]|uniref:Uncharacterized protein n=1 Tax=Hermetia illucens TaxID=343691 RepID=A0A7R8UVY0_HERIL|nr:uncharacterized protein LOC119656143 [Hermetia illucens]XP_037918404.1 uncharacterized protein LOC119656143 [Hermetia illucens]XP_037918405.1 uncharacterized protein LOC119656143 [Hermetia illucens]CAD7087521.1 unnamed protein product [Hermetia illucens]